MSKSSDPRHFFESDAAQATRERRAAKSSNKYGSPIVLKSKILAAIPAPHVSASAIFVAESVGSVRLVKVDTGDTKTVYRGPTAPVTSVALGGPNQGTLFAGCWDKSVWSWDVATCKPGRRYIGHSDFVKTVVCASFGHSKHVLISGGADRKIIVWDVASGQKLHVVQDTVQSMLAVQHLAVDPFATTADEIALFSASSDPDIRSWRLKLTHWEQVVDHGVNKKEKKIPGASSSSSSSQVGGGDEEQQRRTILAHETSVYKLAFDHAGEEVDLYTASGDGTVKCLSRQRGFASGDDDVFEHGDHVKAIVVTDEWVVTAGRDEDVKVWDRASGKLYCSLEGHYDEVTDLVVLPGGGAGAVVGNTGANAAAAAEDRRLLSSVSLDGTVRTWPLQKTQLDALVAEQKAAAEGMVKAPDAEAHTTAAPQENMLSAEEEAELAALMDDDDDD